MEELYKIISADTPAKLVELVNEEIANGFTPAGGLMIGFNEQDGQAFHQAVFMDMRD